MRLVDLVMRQGHLSESALTRAVVDGDRPSHLDRCDICADRAIDLGRWLNEARTAAADTADEAFPAERLSAQQTQILRRLAQLDEPARVIAFPTAPQPLSRDVTGRRVAPAWVGVAAAAGLVVGVIGGQLAPRLDGPRLTPAPDAAVTVEPATTPVSQPLFPAEPHGTSPSILEMELERITPRELQGIDDVTPRLMTTSYTVVQNY